MSDGSTFMGSLLAIIGINIVLAGDNAVVIALAARDLPGHLARRAIVYGTVLAVALRIVLTALVVLLFSIPFVKAVGGLALLVIAWRLGTQDDDDPDVAASGELRTAILTILSADLVMSLDNVLAVAARANGDYRLIVLGLAISIPIVMGGASVLLTVLHRYPWLVWIGVALVAWTGVELFFADERVENFLHAADLGFHMSRTVELFVATAITSFLIAGSFLHGRHNKSKALLKAEGSTAEK
ncbi:MAG: TerC family protein [Thermoleophilia bacterium]|nr:TerC family protein [Thermoleophilia bacterium]